MTTRLQRIAAAPPLELWLADLAAAPDGAADRLAVLDERERERAARFAFDRDRRRYVRAHLDLRDLLAARTGGTPADLRFAEGEFGKPRLLGPGRCAFSLSHSGDSALFGFADAGEIGVDIEALRPLPDLDELARRILAPAERRELAAIAAADRAAAFLRAWTRKEACVKALGLGLQIEPGSFSVGLGSDACRLAIAFRGRDLQLAVESLILPLNVAVATAIWLDPP